MMRIFSLLPFVVLALGPVLPGQAQIIFDGSPGTHAPPSTLGPYLMTKIPDNRPDHQQISSVASPFSGEVSFSRNMLTRTVMASWGTWGHDYSGRVYSLDASAQSVTLTLPTNTKAFYLYIEPDDLGTYAILATTNTNGTSSPITVTGNAGARYFGFYAPQADISLQTITISVESGSLGFSLGEMGIYQCGSPVTPTLTALDGGVLTCATPTLTLMASGGSHYTFLGPGLDQDGSADRAIVSQAGTYSVIVSNTTGCPALATTTITSTRPVISISSSATAVCAGQSTTLTASGGALYRWNTGQTTADLSVATTGTYSVTVSGGSLACPVSASQFVRVDPLPTPILVGLGAAYCIDAATLILSGVPAGGTFTIDDVPTTVFSPASAGAGEHIVVYSYPNAGGCIGTDSRLVTVDALPPSPSLLTQTGQTYPGGVASLTISQNVGNVLLTVSDCPVGTPYWAGRTWGDTFMTAPTTSPGVFSYSATCQANGCYSSAATATVTVVPATLSVLHRDAGNGQLNTNTIQPALQFMNGGSQSVPYGEITLRYWLTVETFAPLTNLSVAYAQLGTDKVHLRYVALQQPRQGATGYVEYRFDSSAGNLDAGASSGPIDNSIAKQNYSSFNQADDYSYVNNPGFTPNTHVTAYRTSPGGVPTIIWGQEPPLLPALLSLKAYTQQNNGPATNTISTTLQLANEGNLPVDYGDVTVRYYFTVDGSQPLTFTPGYSQLGTTNVLTSFVRLNSPLDRADTYLEFSFAPGLGSLYPASGTGPITYEIRKSDYSYFDLNSAYSYQGTSPLVENNHVVIYVAGQRIYGTEPVAGGGGTANGRLAAEGTDALLRVQVLDNPVTGATIGVLVQGAEGQPMRVQLTDLAGRLVSEQQVETAGTVERQTLPVGHQPAGLLLLRVSTPTQSQTVKVLKR